MTLEQSEKLRRGDVLFVDQLYEGGKWLEEAAGSFADNRRAEGTKVLFVQHHHHLPEFLFCEEGGEMAIYHHDELLTRMRIIR